MGERQKLSCPYCDEVFTKAPEFKKHKATHENPESLHYCPICNFFTLTKKNLVIHLGRHTGAKDHACPHMVSQPSSDGSPSREELCTYRTNDPAALSKHRKDKHGYVPPPNRSRKKAISTPSKSGGGESSPKSRKGVDGATSQRYHPYARADPPRREPSLVRSVTTASDSTPEPASICSESSKDSSPFIWQGDVDKHFQLVDLVSDVPGRESPIVGNATTLVAPECNATLGTACDTTLNSDWIARYESGYSLFDVTGMGYLPEPYDVHSTFSDAVGFEAQTGREGCLCPEWMVQFGIEGWDPSDLEAHWHKEVYTLDA